MSLNTVYYDNAIMLEPVKNSFAALALEIYENLGLSITVLESYKYEWEILDELRGKIKNPEIRRSTTLINNTVTDKTKLEELVQIPNAAAVQTYSTLLSFIENLPPEEFEPPIGPNITSQRNSAELVYSIPNYPKLDPRRTGRIVRIGPKALINATLLQYLIQNAGRFGFVFYGPIDPSIWYWRGDKLPVVDPFSGRLNTYYTPQQTTTMFSMELYDLYRATIGLNPWQVAGLTPPSVYVTSSQQPTQSPPPPAPSFTN